MKPASFSQHLAWIRSCLWFWTLTFGLRMQSKSQNVFRCLSAQGWCCWHRKPSPSQHIAGLLGKQPWDSRQQPGHFGVDISARTFHVWSASWHFTAHFLVISFWAMNKRSSGLCHCTTCKGLPTGWGEWLISVFGLAKSLLQGRRGPGVWDNHVPIARPAKLPPGNLLTPLHNSWNVPTSHVHTQKPRLSAETNEGIRKGKKEIENERMWQDLLILELISFLSVKIITIISLKLTIP